MDPHVGGINIANGQGDSFAKAQAEAVGGKEEDAVTYSVCCGKKLVELFDGQDIRNPGCFGGLDQRNILPWFVEDLGVKELEAVEVEFDRAPRMAIQEIVEIVQELIGRQVFDTALEIVADAPDRPCVGFNGFGL